MLSKKLLETIPKSIRTIRKLTSETLTESLTFQQMRILILINEGQSQSQMAETLQVSHAAISKMISSLTKKKFVLCKIGADRRTHVLHVTPKSKKILKKTVNYVCSKLDIGINDLSKDEKEQLMKGLLILDRVMTKVKEV
jgi:DNA-binding MarR family transcriptional regulator